MGIHDSLDLVILRQLIDDPLGEEPALRVVQSRVVLDLLLEVWLVRKDAAEDEAFVDARKDETAATSATAVVVVLAIGAAATSVVAAAAATARVAGGSALQR